MAEITVIDIKKNSDKKNIITQYVNLRNRYVDLLLASPVEVDETIEWLEKSDIEIRGLIKEGVLCGVGILYLNKGGEVTFFVDEPKKGYGSRLLKIMDEAAKERGLESVWAWVLDYNHGAQKAFEKNGYFRDKVAQRNYNQKEHRGILYRKILQSQEKG